MGISDEELQRLGEQAWRADILRAVRERTDAVPDINYSYSPAVNIALYRGRQEDALGTLEEFRSPILEEWVLKARQEADRRGSFFMPQYKLLELSSEELAKLNTDLYEAAKVLEVHIEIFHSYEPPGWKIDWYPKEELRAIYGGY